MNKETIYIEPSDDITDILSRLKASDKKVIALVPPKKPTVLLSSVNIKLIARAAKADKKAIVLVTTNDSLTKLAMTANLPVAPSLKSRPVMPGEEKQASSEEPKPETKEESTTPPNHEDDDEDDESEDDSEDGPSEEADEEDNEEPDEEDDDSDSEEEEEENDEEDDDENEEDDDNEDDEEDDKEDDDEGEDEDEDEDGKKPKRKTSAKPSKKSAEKPKKSEKEYSNGFTGFLAKHKIWIIITAIALIGIALFLIWAFTIAPRVNVSVSVRTTSANFSENVTFSKNTADENSSTGAFYLHEEKVEKDQVVKFTATGKKDLGETASGELVLYAYFIGPGSVSVPAGSVFTFGRLDYTTLSEITLVGPADTKAKTFNATCNNYSEDFRIGVDYCQVQATVSIKATAPGEDYNVSASSEGWSTSVSGVSAENRSDITGGTSNIVTVVLQSDVDLALDKLRSEESAGSKEELYRGLSETVMPVEASFKVSTSDPQTTPGIGEEVKDGVTPQVSTKTTYSVYTIDRVRLEEFIKNKASIEDGKRLYSIGEPFIEYFSEGGNNTYTGKLKTTYKVGPEISETEVLDKIRGEKIGRIEPKLKDAFSGISSVKIEKSYFWVNSVPNDENKVEIKLTVEE